MTTAELLRRGVDLLKSLPDCEPFLEARILLRRAAGLTDLDVFAYPERPVSSSVSRRFLRAAEERSRRRPQAYILGEKEFWSIPMTVSPAVLIPRPETELLVEQALAFLTSAEPLIIEIGTGSGCIAVALAKELPGACIYATDISRRALAVARANAFRHGAPNVRFFAGDLFGALRGLVMEGRADLVVSNPPYVSAKEWAGLAPEVRDYEPRRALVPGPTGLEMIRRIARGAGRFLKPGGRILLEFGAGQEVAVLRLFGSGWKNPATVDDLSGRPRVLSASR
ncbi:MAG: peptide chain release factor N(5)-glutamine methyltransferase [Candidatus Aminicenantes bacterium]|nr:peptide chain release factor N(5)-glutamine methyltransferase [Candidatus Aminicenantes bacterium]